MGARVRDERPAAAAAAAAASFDCDCECEPCIVEVAARALGGPMPAEEALAAAPDAAAPDGPSDNDAPRDMDSATRGLGGSVCTSCGEENLLSIENDPHFREESILVHEFGHTVMNLGMDDLGRAMVRRCYDDAMARGLYAPGCYMGSCADEYWAEGTQSWFDATVRTDVNGGVNTRRKLCAHDPALALLLAVTYGDGPWRFTDELSAACADDWRARQAEPSTAPAPVGQVCLRRVRKRALESGECKAVAPPLALPAPAPEPALLQTRVEAVAEAQAAEEDRALALAVAESLSQAAAMDEST